MNKEILNDSIPLDLWSRLALTYTAWLGHMGLEETEDIVLGSFFCGGFENQIPDEDFIIMLEGKEGTKKCEGD